MEGAAMRAVIKASVISGRASAPPSKSMAHRIIISAALAGGTSTIENVAESEDILATMSCLRALGAEISGESSRGHRYKTFQIRGADPSIAEEAVLDANESGSTLRFLIPVAALSGSGMIFKGSETLMKRPLSVYEDIFKERNLEFKPGREGLRIRGRLGGGEYRLPGDISSQFISGLLFALPLCTGDSIIIPEGRIESRPYIEMTMNALSRFGVRTYWQKDAIHVPGGQRYKTAEMKVEADWSNAAYLMALGAEVDGLDENSLQGDKVCVEHLRQLREGCAEIDITDVPDLGPALMAYAAMNHGCTLRGTGRLRIKESDRGLAMQEELSKFGVKTDVEDNAIRVGCGAGKPREILSSHNDHRIVMALAAICARTGGIIEGAEAVAKSFPDYFEIISDLGVAVEKEN